MLSYYASIISMVFRNVLYVTIDLLLSANYFESGRESTCIDVIDTWNKTQREWSARFGCHVPAKDAFLLGAFTSFILLLPLIFYLSVYLNSEHKRQTFAKMKVRNFWEHIVFTMWGKFYVQIFNFAEQVNPRSKCLYFLHEK